MSIKNTILYGVLALVVILFATNPSTNDFKSKVTASYSEAGGKEQWLIKMLGKVGSLQVSRKSYVLFSVFKSQGKSLIGDSEATYYFGILGNISTLKKGEMQWLTQGKYNESIGVSAKDL